MLNESLFLFSRSDNHVSAVSLMATECWPLKCDDFLPAFPCPTKQAIFILNAQQNYTADRKAPLTHYASNEKY